MQLSILQSRWLIDRQTICRDAPHPTTISVQLKHLSSKAGSRFSRDGPKIDLLRLGLTRRAFKSALVR